MLLVEVADTSEDYDREVKMPLYARYGIPEAWLVDLSSRTIEVYRDPSPEGYGDVQQVGQGRRIAPQALPWSGFDSGRGSLASCQSWEHPVEVVDNIAEDV